MSINVSVNEFLSAFFEPDDTVCFRVFSDRKDAVPDYKGNKYAEKLKDMDALVALLKQHNERNRGIFFVVNSGGQNDTDIVRINAQFVECDTLSIDEQMARLEAFALPPSIIVRTKKSLHSYWLMMDAAASRFRELQLRLVKHFDGDSQCQNESRVLRIPGFMHCKSDPVMVKCLKFKPSLRYTQEELAAHLPEIDIPNMDAAGRSAFDGVVGNGQRIIDKCVFVRYCRDNAAALSEPQWYAMVTNVAPARDGAALVHEISKPYPKYNRAETDGKIRHALAENKPHTCAYIKKSLGFTGCAGCNGADRAVVKSPVVHCVLTMTEQVEEFMESEFDPDIIFAPNTIRLMSYAKKHAPAAYGRYKQIIKGKASIRDFENAVRHEENGNFIVEDGEMPLNLTDIELYGAVQPGGWDVTMEHGVRKNISSNGGYITVTVCPSPVVISKRFENVDNKCEKVEISFYRDHHWKKFTAARSTVFNKSALIGCGDHGLPVNSANAGDLVAYLSSYENANLNKIPLMKSTERLGWLSETEFFPYTSKKDVCFETEMQESDEVHRSLSERGSYEVWQSAAAKLRKNPFARFMLAAAFAAPLLEPLSHRVFFVNIWHDTTSGKSAAAKLAVAAWGNPLKIMGSFNATAVGLERKADTLRHILYGLDERQLANEKRLPISQIVYGLANGFGRIRGAKEGGVQSVTSWRTIVLSTGEEPLITEDAHDGLGTRVLELHGQPAPDKSFGKELHGLSEKNYGFAGKMFIERLCKELTVRKDMVTADFNSVLSAMRDKFSTAAQLENAAVVALGDFYSDMWLWHTDRDEAFKVSVETALLMLENNIAHEKEDIVSRAWQHVQDWCVANDRAFGTDAPIRYGLKEGVGTYYVLKFALDEALQKKNYPVEKSKTGFFERGYMPLWNGKRQKQKKNGGITSWYYVVDVPISDTDEMTPL